MQLWCVCSFRKEYLEVIYFKGCVCVCVTKQYCQRFCTLAKSMSKLLVCKEVNLYVKEFRNSTFLTVLKCSRKSFTR